MPFAMLPDLPDGVYFDMPSEVYHALPRIGSGGLCDLLVSPATFWAGSWLNSSAAEKRAAAAFNALGAMVESMPDYLNDYGAALRKAGFKPAGDLAGEDESKAMILGRAYHCARLERDQLDKRFVRGLDKRDFAERVAKLGAVWNGTEIGDALAERGETKKKAGESVFGQAQRLRKCGFAGIIWPIEVAEFEAGLSGRTVIPADLWDDMIEDAERLRASPEVAELLAGGVAEVSVLHTGRSGIRRKARFDYLAPSHWADFKTFANPLGKNLLRVIREAFQFQRHYIQAVAYREAAQLLLQEALPVMSPATDDQRALMAKLAITPHDLACWYVYQEKNGVPNILARSVRFFDIPPGAQAQNAMMAAAGTPPENIEKVADATRTETLWHQRANAEIGKALRDFELYSEICEPGKPWLPIHAIGEFSDDDFPIPFLDERI